MKEWIGRRCKIFVRGLSDHAIIYTAEVQSIENNFITFKDLWGEKITVNIADIIQIKEDDERQKSFYQA
jgi:hypothetical protein